MTSRQRVLLIAQQLWWRIRHVSAQLRAGVAIAIAAVAGLVWIQYGTSAVEPESGLAGQGQEQLHVEQTPDLRQEGQPDDSALPDWTEQAARIVVERFAANFADPGLGQSEWLARLRPDIAPELADQYQLTDIRNVPIATVVTVDGPLGEAPGSAIFHVAYSDGTRTQVELYIDAEGWKVATVVPLSAAPPPPPAPAPEVGPVLGPVEDGAGR